MMKIAFVVAAAVLTTVPLVTPAKAQGVKMAQVDMPLLLQRHSWRRSRRCHHRPTTSLPHGD